MFSFLGNGKLTVNQPTPERREWGTDQSNKQTLQVAWKTALFVYNIALFFTYSSSSLLLYKNYKKRKK